MPGSTREPTSAAAAEFDAGDGSAEKMLRRSLLVVPEFWGLSAGIILIAFVSSILRFTPYELKLVLIQAIPISIIFSVVSAIPRKRSIKEILYFLELRETNRASESDCESAFNLLVNYPRREVLYAATCWFVLPIPMLTVLITFSDTFALASAFSIVLAVVGTCGLNQGFVFLHLKQRLAPLVSIAATGIPNDQRRRELIKPLSIEFKLSLGFVVVVLVSTYFSVTLALSGQYRFAEARGIAPATALVDELLPQTGDVAMGLQPAFPTFELSLPAGTAEMITIETSSGEIISGEAPLLAGEILAIIDSHSPRGTSILFDTPHTFSWASTEDGQYILVAVVPTAPLATDPLSDNLIFSAIMALFILAALYFARLQARDLAASVGNLRRAAERVAAGDLRSIDVFESEDELGGLAREIDRMTGSLRATISGVSVAAGRVDSVSNQIAQIAIEVAQSGEAQSASSSALAQAMDAIRREANGIEASAEQLTSSVASSASSIHSLASTGKDLRNSGEIMAETVTQVVVSVRGIVEGIDRAKQSSAILTRASDSTNEGIQNIADTMKEIEDNAAETSELSNQVVEAANAGHQRVHETKEGISSTRDDAERAATILNVLGTRSQEVDAIISLIARVSDDTKLLALNAAIIAAKAGSGGQAFRVVATEIKNLAARVLNQTQDVTEIIQAVQTGVGDAISAVESCQTSVGTGVELSNQAEQSLGIISGAAQQSGSRMDEVVSAVRSQSVAAGEMVSMIHELQQAIAEIDETTQSQGARTSSVQTQTRLLDEAVSRVQDTARHQAASAEEITASFADVTSATKLISGALTQQMHSVERVADSSAALNSTARSTEVSTQRLEDASRSLGEEASKLRDSVESFSID